MPNIFRAMHNQKKSTYASLNPTKILPQLVGTFEEENEIHVTETDQRTLTSTSSGIKLQDNV